MDEKKKESTSDPSPPPDPKISGLRLASELQKLLEGRPKAEVRVALAALAPLHGGTFSLDSERERLHYVQIATAARAGIASGRGRKEKPPKQSPAAWKKNPKWVSHQVKKSELLVKLSKFEKTDLSAPAEQIRGEYKDLLLQEKILKEDLRS
jgi:hypothetical protein